MSHKLVSLHIGDGEYYTRTDADAVIAELKKDVEAWIGSYEASRRVNARTESKLRHSNYKRCLAMADFCESQRDYYNTLANGFWLVRGDVKKRDEYRKRASDFWWKWHKRWHKLAEKFRDKEA